MAALARSLILLAACTTPVAALAYTRPTMPASVVKLERASRELCVTYIYEGLVQRCDPLALFDDQDHQDFWFTGSKKAVAETLKSATIEHDYAPRPVEPKAKKFNAPLNAKRYERAQKSFTQPPPTLQRARPKGLPDDAVPDGPETSAPDRRSDASRGLVRAKLEILRPRRVELEEAIAEQLDPKIAESVPCMDVAILLLFLSEMSAEGPGGDALPPPVAAKEAVALSVAYSGDEKQSFRYVHGVIGAFARERLGYLEPMGS